MITGHKAEELFKHTMEIAGHTVIAATKDEDMYHHIDFFVDGEGYDVKGEKRYNREDESVTDVIWIENTNVRGDPGWLNGQAKYIAFLIGEEFVIVDRKKLAEYIKNNMRSEKVFNVKGYKKWYRREGRQDIITYIYPRDLEKSVVVRRKVVYLPNEEENKNSKEGSQT